MMNEPCVHDLVAVQPPGRVAIVYRDEQLTYGELNARADRLAARLTREGVGVETPVGVFLERSPELIVTFLAILRAGGYYVPLDPAYPAARLALMLEATNAPAIVTLPALAERLPATDAIVLTPDDHPHLHAVALDRPRVGPENLAYAMFTSGSTGRPKGVAVRHSGVTRLVHHPGYVCLDEDEVVLHMSSTSFDAATFEIWGALANGARLVISPSGQSSVHELTALIQEHQVTAAFFTTGLFHLMADEYPEALSGLRQLLTGGDVLSPTRARRFTQAVPSCRLINAYGPTEATTFTTTHPVAEADTPIGLPIRATSTHVLDEDLNPADEGRLYVGGAGLARGYVGDPAFTAERFIPDPWTPGERLYDTGDLVRRRSDGVLDFLGRADNQIKRRGFRVEPAEIEEALRTDPDVQDAAIVVQGDSAEDKILVAHIVNLGPLDAIRSRLAETLPAYLLPDRWLESAGLPLNANGKVDRRALQVVPATEIQATDDLENEVESSIAAIWRELFKLNDVGRHDDFFELGGHSLLATRMVSRLRTRLGVELPLAAVFDHPTIAEMAGLIDAA
ncbi:non-ribosomal peptide synthetase [Actinomadura barringtoniae]|uniref:Non-ribosomal peptide synthetase n=1 Tax=Actinomadura barringtoniae TaxID=1427535 RepID=A0A939P7C0_9ACTN|nr:non-ribosomal peptide synthetase [Actinomadura barringtoniae]MBO2447072.1 non-ribosomal peptide synthetase [Actinomadura barringtoniae]